MLETSSNSSLDAIEAHASSPFHNLVKKSDRDVAGAIAQELSKQRTTLKLIASENYSSLGVQAAMANCLTDKYAEGYVGRRFYAGCEHVDRIEEIAQERAKKLFGVDYAFVQPHCGADANLLAYHAVLSAKIQEPFLEKLQVKNLSKLSEAQFEELRGELGHQKLLAMSLEAGGHLTHGYRMNLSARLFQSYHYGLNEEMQVDYDQIRDLALKQRPLILLAGYSAHTRRLNFQLLREIADEVGSVLMGDIAHFSGLVAGKQFAAHEDPAKHCDIITSTTHKTLRGPRGGIVLCRSWLQSYVQKACPLVMGGPLPHVIAAKAIAFSEALAPSFVDYSADVITNARALAQALKQEGLDLLTGGTDNHMVLIDLRRQKASGLQVERALAKLGITTNRNAIFGDPRGPWQTSGLRLGTPALTTRGMGEEEMHQIGAMIASITKDLNPEEGTCSQEMEKKAFELVAHLTERFPLYQGL